MLAGLRASAGAALRVIMVVRADHTQTPTRPLDRAPSPGGTCTKGVLDTPRYAHQNFTHL